MKRGPSRSGESRIGVASKKVFSFGKEEVLDFTGPKISSISCPRFPLPRRSSASSFQDDFDDPEFSCPFAADDDDIMDPSNRSKAAIGVLIRMLKTAPPLHQECSKSADFSQVPKAESLSKNTQDKNAKVLTTGVALQDDGLDAPLMTASRLIMLKTTADALEELNGYREMKESLLRQDGHLPSDAT